MKSLVQLWYSLAEELGQVCGVSTARDMKTVTSRVECEGLSFLTITLPTLARALERGLAVGRVAPTDFTGFRCRGPLPLFLGGFLAQVFDSRTGLVRPDASTDAVFAVRQLTRVFGKVELPCADHRVRAAFRRYVEIEGELRDTVVPDSDLDRLADIAGVLFRDVFAACENDLFTKQLTPNHGPGSVAERLSANQRYHIKVWPDRLEEVFPYLENALPSHSYYQELDRVEFPSPEHEPTSRLTCVHKTLKTPRIISIEPAAQQYMQQGLRSLLVPLLEAERVVGAVRRNLCYPMIGFTDQSPNRDMACEGSLNGTLATLDLSDASDRVSIHHVRAVFRDSPLLLEALEAVRTERTRVPGHGVLTLTKYASMGSATTFPVEAMVFLAVVFYGICSGESARDLRREISALQDRVRVYGDDIIVPTGLASDVIAALELFGFRVNTHKSFTTGNFRESCGGDYFMGVDVTPVKLKQLIPSSHRDARAVLGFTKFRNHLYWRGLWKTAYLIDQHLEKLLNGSYPYVSQTAGIVGRESALGLFSDESQRTHRDYQVPLVKGWTVVAKPPQDVLSGWPALLKFFLKKGDEPYQEKHLEQFGRPHAVSIKRGWLSPE